MTSVWKWVFLTLSVALCLIAVEVAARILEPPSPGFPTFANFTANHIIGLGVFDEELGWTPTPNTRAPGYIIDDRGYRITENQIEYRSQAMILAVGDSYTYGAEVSNKDTWPSILERKLRVRVLNGGVGGYGLGQMLTRVVRTLAFASPHTILVAVVSEDLDRTRLRVRHGFNQPYFRLDASGDLQLVRAIDNRLTNEPDLFKRVFGYSYAAHLFMTGLFSDYWIRGTIYDFRYADVDLLAVSRKIVDELKREVSDIRHINLVFVLLPSSWIDFNMVTNQVPVLHAIADYMAQTARRSQGIYVVDMQNGLKRLSGSDEERKRLFGVRGHFNETGTELVAATLASFMDENGDVIEEAIAPYLFDGARPRRSDARPPATTLAQPSRLQP